MEQIEQQTKVGLPNDNQDPILGVTDCMSFVVDKLRPQIGSKFGLLQGTFSVVTLRRTDLPKGSRAGLICILAPDVSSQHTIACRANYFVVILHKCTQRNGSLAMPLPALLLTPWHIIHTRLLEEAVKLHRAVLRLPRLSTQCVVPGQSKEVARAIVKDGSVECAGESSFVCCPQRI